MKMHWRRDEARGELVLSVSGESKFEKELLEGLLRRPLSAREVPEAETDHLPLGCVELVAGREPADAGKKPARG